MASIGENQLPQAAAGNPILKGTAASQQQQQPRQVLGNVGNSGLNLVQIQKKKEQFIAQEQQQQHKKLAPIAETSAISVIQSDYGFAIYTDENSGASGDLPSGKEDQKQTDRLSSENAENLPPTKVCHGLLPSVISGEAANHSFASVQPIPIQGKAQLEDKNRTPFSEIITDTPVEPSVIPSGHIGHHLNTYREHIYELPEYQGDILEYLKEAEVKFRPKPDYMRKQPDINGNMRTVLVDWIVEVCEEYRLNSETLYLAVSYVDRFLSMMSVVRSKLQLVGTSAMFIAAKLEEIYPPDVADFVYITDDTYTKKQVLRMEQLILRALSFDMSAPTAHVFVNLYSAMEDLSEPVRHLATYLCELSLLYSTPFLQYLPSRTAAAALAYARLLLNYEGRMWTRGMELMTGYELSHLQQVICELSLVHEKSGSMAQKAVVEKYRAAKYSEVALIEAVELTEATFAEAADSIAKELEEAVKGMSV